MTIKNYDEVVEKLTGILMQLAEEFNQYNTDIYLYYNEETQTATLDTFVNPGGNSWLNDNHYTIYTDKQHYDTFLDYWESIAEFAEALDITEEKLIEYAAEYFRYETDEIDYYDIRKFINYHPKYFDELVEQYKNMIGDHVSDYAEQAEQIMELFLEKVEEENNI